MINSLRKALKFINPLFIGINRKPLLASAFLFLFFFLVNSIFYFTVKGVSSYDDQWFHFKYSYLLRTNGWDVVRNFKWLYFTNLAQDNLNYAVTLYHYFLIPFTFVGDKIIGLKLAGITFASAVPAILFYVLRKFDVKKSLLWVLFFFVFSSYNVIWRLFINRNFVLVDGLILLEIYLATRRKYWPLFVIGAFHTWWHPGTFWTTPLIVIVYELIRYINLQQIGYKKILAGISGAIAGFILFPPHSDHLFSPMNPISWLRMLPSFFYGMKKGIGVREGVEAYNKDFLSFIANNQFIFFALVFVIAFNIFLYVYKKRGGEDLDKNADRIVLRESLFLLIIIFFLGDITISQRFEDLLIPLLFLEIVILAKFFHDSKLIQVNSGLLKKTFAVTSIVFVSYLFANRFLDVRKSYGDESRYIKYEKSADWLKKNTREKEIIFNTNWSSFPPLFFYDDWNYYIVGIEPKSFYRYNEELYWLWHNISYNGIICNDRDCSQEINQMLEGKSDKETGEIYIKNAKSILPVIKERFKSRYIFFDENTLLKKELDKDSEDYSLVYNDEENGVYIYKLR